MRPVFVEPMLATLVDTPPGGDDWIHEIKHDGYRTQLVIDGKNVRAFTRRGVDWTVKYRSIVTAAMKLPTKSAIIDGEMVVFDQNGKSSINDGGEEQFWQRDITCPAEVLIAVVWSMG